jgi:predicted neuraminidase/peroxiredoxin
MAVSVGDVIESATLESLYGDSLDLDNFDERPGTVLVFLSARCPQSEAELANIAALSEFHSSHEILFVGLFPKQEEDSPELRAFCHHRGVVFPVYRDPESKLAKTLGVKVTPEVVFLDNKGTVVYRGHCGGPKERGGLDDAINRVRLFQPVRVSTTEADGTPIDASRQPRDWDNRYKPLSFSSELIFESIPDAPAHHCSSLTETAEGDLLCAWYGGSYESADDECVYIARREKGRRRWQNPEVQIPRNADQPPGNPVVFTDAEGKIWLTWSRMEASRPIRRASGWSQCTMLYRVSEDHGRTWSADREIADSFGLVPRNAPTRLSDDSVLLPVSDEIEGQKAGMFLISRDECATWHRSSLIEGGIQPTAAEREDGSLVAFLRAEPRLLMTTSDDRGLTWTPPQPTPFRNPNASAALQRLDSGRIVLVFNDSETGRTPLSLVHSDDDGITWSEPILLETGPGEYSLPCMVQTQDGMVHVTYTYRRYSIKHAQFNEAWLTEFSRPC